MKDERARFLHDTLSPARRTRVVDVGANPLGETPYATLLRNGLCEVWGFEPQKDAYDKLIAEKGELDHYLPHAIGNGRRGSLHVCKGGGFTSLYKPNPKFLGLMGRWEAGMTVKEVVEVPTRRLDSLTEIPEFDLLKIDVQGSEAAVFRGAKAALQSAVAVITEAAVIPLYQDQPLLDAQMKELQAIGFYLHKFLFLKSYMVRGKSPDRLRPRRNKNQGVDGDVVFLRDIMSIEEYETEKLKHLAMLADSAFESFDIAVLALDILAERGEIGQSGIDGYIARLPAEVVR
ncbi:methyltransferase, FkbM family [Lutimaribacter pacificus]|uniref:Methyltransferase, FkbM family n=1 Tax=Lutimaribacter pacificus TaxID=391948 RepID=A0A1H0J200_9RHOB|nr:FkbM family methyltransferase [Lutimaribacter pacificus]SDO37573.1 methyltransferase, FkbM family [Lutimaribacter pacificus]SHK15097.1 methyltransferase, FkbM family [Lutimaribacter pacificus]